MTPLAEQDRRAAPRQARTEIGVAARQLRAIDAFNAARQAAAQAAAAASRSREMRMDASRALEVLRRQHEALIARADEQLRLSGDLLHGFAARRAVVAHRNEWFTGTLSRLLEGGGVEVVARLDNGADAVGVAVAEQPDLLLVEDTLAMLSGEQVVREVRQFCPETLVAAQVAGSDRVGALLEAGAATVFTRRIPPADVADDLLRLVTA